jgi:copper(I)-binding protein
VRTTILIVALLIAACAETDKAPLVATDIVITQPMLAKSMRAAYLSLTNNTDENIRITQVTSDVFSSVQLHETTVTDGVARMRKLPQLDIPAGGTVRLERGGKHLMLMRAVGAADTTTLQFFDGDSLLLEVSAPLAPGKN